jgi:hypothetical protein
MPTFNAIPSTVPFLTGDKFIELILGCVGSTKTSASLIKLIHEAKRVAPCADGIRRSRCAIIRNTREQLADTTIPDFLKWYPDGEAGAYMKTGMRYMLKVDDVECEVLFRGLDDSNDVRRLLSLQLSFAMMDEFREINADVFNALTGRLGRYPDKTMNGVGCCDDAGKQIHKVWGASNPPDADTFWHTFIENPPENAHVVIQPSGRSPEADWLHCLPDGYYENLCHGKTEEWISIYVDGQFGKSLSGSPVFKCFNRDTHVAERPLIPNRVSANSIMVGFDCTGLNPACVVGQIGFGGRLMIYDELFSIDMGPLRFMKEMLKPLLVEKYANQSIVLVIDPAGNMRESDERSVKDMLVSEGFTVRAAKTNNLAPRVSAVESFMTRTSDGKPCFVVDPRCTTLIRALAGKYRYKVNTKGERDDKPEKSHPYADVVDSLQYLCLHADGGTLFGTPVSVRREIKPAAFKWAV